MSTSTPSTSALRVLSGGAIEPGLHAACEAFEKETATAVEITFATAPELVKKLQDDGHFDIVIAPPPIIEALKGLGLIGEGRFAVGKVGIGVAVRVDAASPDISSQEAFVSELLAADSVIYNRASTGQYLEELMGKLGIDEALMDKTVRYRDGASVMRHVIEGKGRDIGLGPLTEILLCVNDGLKLVGPLPDAVQKFTSYAAVPVAGSAKGEAAGGLLEFLVGARGRGLFEGAGITVSVSVDDMSLPIVSS